MAVMDEFKEERANLKNKPLRKKIGYFWMYYKWYVIVGVIAVAAIAGTAYSIANQKADALFGVTLNGMPTQNEEAFLNGFMEYAGIDTEEYTFNVNASLHMSSARDKSSMSAAEFIMVYTIAGDMDFMTADPWAYTHYMYNDIFADLSTLMDEETLQALEGKILYSDAAVIREIRELQSDGKSADAVSLPNPFHPEEMKEPVPVGIDISNCEAFTDAYYYQNGTAYIGIISSSDRKEVAVEFIEYLLGE